MSNFPQTRFFAIHTRDQNNITNMSKNLLFYRERVQHNAAVKIQKIIRGFLVRKNIAIAYRKEKGIDDTFKETYLIKIIVLVSDFRDRLCHVSGIKDYEERVSRKLLLLEQYAFQIAATKIQKVFRGFFVRKIDPFNRLIKEIEAAAFTKTRPVANSIRFTDDLCAEINGEDKSKHLMEKMKEIDGALIINEANDSSTTDVGDDFVHVDVELPELLDELNDLKGFSFDEWDIIEKDELID